MSNRAKIASIVLEIGIGIAFFVAGILINRWLLIEQSGQASAGMVLAPFSLGMLAIAHGLFRLLPDPRVSTRVRIGTVHERMVSLWFLALALAMVTAGIALDRNIVAGGLVGSLSAYGCFAIGAGALVVGLWLFKPVAEASAFPIWLLFLGLLLLALGIGLERRFATELTVRYVTSCSIIVA